MNQVQKIPIDPPIQKTLIFDSMEITCINIILNTQATFKVLCYNNNNFEKQYIFIMSGQAYQDWTTDNYVADWVLTQLLNT
jgi:hypothetical protein